MIRVEPVEMGELNMVVTKLSLDKTDPRLGKRTTSLTGTFSRSK